MQFNAATCTVNNSAANVTVIIIFLLKIRQWNADSIDHRNGVQNSNRMNMIAEQKMMAEVTLFFIYGSGNGV